MDKRKLSAMMRLKTGWDKQASDHAIELVFESIRDLLQNGNRLTIHGFGSFIVRLNKPRKGRNIKTGETVFVPARKNVKFRMSPDFLQ
ncbi:MAG: integration host factor subunit beta [Elusimicrobia bacterium]|nr:integration host factor subunit beta [Elusimicrobiota bacterium]